MRIGVLINASSAPPAFTNPYDTANAFMIGYADTGPAGSAVPCTTITQVANIIGARSATNQKLWDAADLYLREGGAKLYLSRVVGNTPTLAALTLNDNLASPKPTVTITAKYPTVAGLVYDATVTQTAAATFTANTATNTTLSNISSFANLAPGTLITGAGIAAGTYIVSVNTGAGTAVLSTATTATATGVTITPYTFTVTITDTSGQLPTETHGPYMNTAALYQDTTSQMVTFAQATGMGNTINSPAVLTATALSGGTDDRGTATITNHQTALAAFGPALGPGQVSAPGVTNTTLNGIWSALDTHANTNNRVAVKDDDDATAAATLVTNLGDYGAAATAAWGAIWAGNVQAPGVVASTTRTVAPSPVISALCARADATGNPNLAAAGMGFPLRYVSGFTGLNGAPLYGQADIDTLNAAGINTWNNVFGINQNYGFVTPVPQTTDAVFWQFSHSRLRMAIIAAFQVVSAPFVFSQLDGKGLDIAAFSGDLATILSGYAKKNAISTLAPDGSQDQGFVIDTSPNTPPTMAAGQLLANVSFRPAPFAQLVEVQLAAIPTTQAL
jgi:hypothetical protein